MTLHFLDLVACLPVWIILWFHSQKENVGACLDLVTSASFNLKKIVSPIGPFFFDRLWEAYSDCAEIGVYTTAPWSLRERGLSSWR